MADEPKPYKTYSIPTENGSFFAHFYGSGPAYALALHGFNQDGTYFEALSRQFPQLTICAIDLPWHGKTEWKSESYKLRDFDPIIKFMDTQGPIHLIGFSLGCRIAISLSQIYPRLTRSMILLSPDGIAGPYRWLTEFIPPFLRKRLASILDKPDWALKASAFLYQNNLLNRFPHLFMQKHLKDTASRERLFNTWQSLPNFPVTLGVNVDTPTHFIIGERDELVRVEAIREFAQLLSQHKVHLVDRGHDVLPIPPDLGLFN